MKKTESQNVEYKRIWRDDYLRWICGYANAEGGTIWLGIEDDKTVFGIENTQKLMEDIPNKIRDT
ncbi:MAG: ATP-binding protein, partial [Victivallales bacterium]|nr:ATP-binding protein [Victivallales bacterium]